MREDMMIEASNHVLETLPSRVPVRTADAGVPTSMDTPSVSVTGESTQTDSTINSKTREFKPFGKDGFDFFDLLDVVNPLQHIPVISTIYRRMTGDELSPAARVAGATLFVGPIGTALAVADSIVEYETGQDTGDNLYAAMFGDGGPIPQAGTAVADAGPKAAPNTGGLWHDPDKMSDADYLAMHAALSGSGTSGSAARSALVPPQAPDLGALAELTVTAGQHPVLTAQPKGRGEEGQDQAPIEPEPMRSAQPWINPDSIPLSVQNAEAEPLAKTFTVPTATAALAAAQKMTDEVDRPAAPKATNIDVERPMPSDAAKAQAINALAAMPTSQTTAAVAELAQSGPRNTPRHHMALLPSDIPRGASASLSRGATKAYANSMAKRRTPEQIASAQAAEARAQAIMAANAQSTALGASTANNVEKTTARAQNDWMLESMQRAMAKYEASMKLRNAANDQTSNLAVVH
jgi:hypothetical protein